MRNKHLDVLVIGDWFYLDLPVWGSFLFSLFSSIWYNYRFPPPGVSMAGEASREPHQNPYSRNNFDLGISCSSSHYHFSSEQSSFKKLPLFKHLPCAGLLTCDSPNAHNNLARLYYFSIFQMYRLA